MTDQQTTPIPALDYQEWVRFLTEYAESAAHEAEHHETTWPQLVADLALAFRYLRSDPALTPEHVLVPIETLTALLGAWSELTAHLGRDAVPAEGDDAADDLTEIVGTVLS